MDRTDEEGRNDEETAAEAELLLVMGDLSHIVHNASNLVLGHLAAIQREAGPAERLDERAVVIDRALGRITDVVDALRAAVDPAYWGPPATTRLEDVISEALAKAEEEALRRRVRLEREPGALDDPERAIWLADGPPIASLISAIVASELEAVGSDGCIAVRWSRVGDERIAIEVSVRRDDGLPLQARDQPSVWRWIAHRLAAATDASLTSEDEGRTTRITVPVAVEPPRR